MEIEKNVLLDLALDAGLDEDCLYLNYSGRGMYGAKCFGIVGGQHTFAKFLVEAARSVDGVQNLGDQMAESVHLDNMGHELIFYFPNITVVEDGEDF